MYMYVYVYVYIYINAVEQVECYSPYGLVTQAYVTKLLVVYLCWHWYSRHYSRKRQQISRTDTTFLTRWFSN